MGTKELSHCKAIISYMLAATLIGGTIAPPARSQSLVDRLRSLISPSTNRGTADGRSRGGAIRGACKATEDSIEPTVIALIPKNNVGTTLAANPTFWFYLPVFRVDPPVAQPNAAPVPVTSGKFMLLDAAGQPVLKAPILVKLPNKPGFARFALPSDAARWQRGKSLEVGKRYNWFFSVVCDTNQPAKNPSVRGWVERVAQPPQLESQLKQTSASNRYTIYVQNGIWYESLTALAENRQTASASWTELLRGLGLLAVAQAQLGVLQSIDTQ